MHLLEREVIPEFYARDERGIPRRWIARVRESMARLTPTFSTNRAVRQYTDEHYLSAATAFRLRAENRGSLGADLVAWKADLAKHWSALRFGAATVQQQGEHIHFPGSGLSWRSEPRCCTSRTLRGRAERCGPNYTTHESWRHGGWSNEWRYIHCRCPDPRPPADYTPRLIPQHVRAMVPLEAPFILWHDAPSWR